MGQFKHMGAPLIATLLLLGCSTKPPSATINTETHSKKVIIKGNQNQVNVYEYERDTLR